MARANRVDWAHNVTDLETALLGSLGFSTKFIMSKTGYTPSQVTYRLHKGHIRRLDYRDGYSAEANTVMESVHKSVLKSLKHRLTAPNGVTTVKPAEHKKEQ